MFMADKTYILLKRPEVARNKGLSPIEPRMAAQVASSRLVGWLALRMPRIALAMRRPQKTMRYTQGRPFEKPCLKMTAPARMMDGM